MPSYTSSDIRNVALVGQAGAGKTSLAEALLLKAGAIHHLGLVEKGATASDFTDEEKERGHSIYNSILHADHQGKHLNLLDTPGYPDFIGQAIGALSAVEIVAVVVSASAGLDATTRRMMERAAGLKLARLIVINKIDAENVDLPKVLASIQDVFGNSCLPVNLPANNATTVIDCLQNQEGESDLGSVADAHAKLIEQVVMADDELMNVYLDKGEAGLQSEQLRALFVKSMREGSLTPICFASARRHDKPEEAVGIGELLDLLIRMGPSPVESAPKTFLQGESKQETLFAPDPAKHAIAHVFQIMIDPFVGKISAFRVHRGRIATGSMLFVNDPKQGEQKKAVKANHLFEFQGKEHKEIPEAIPGDIVALAKIDEIHRGATLHDRQEDHELSLKPLTYPVPMYGLAITALRRGEEQKISDALHRILAEDATFKVVRDPATHETVIYGLGELHLRVILERLKNRYHVEVDTKPPKIGYRETVLTSADGHHRHKKQTGGAGQFGEVYLRVEPLPRGSGFEFVNEVFGGSIPSQYIPAVEKGVRQVLETGAIAGYPLQDIKVAVTDGKHHPVDSKEVAFVTAGKRAFIDAIQKAKPVLLEPCVHLEVTVPSQYMGDIAGDLSGKRGRIQGTEMEGSDMAIIKAIVPLSEVANYQNQLKSVTGGQGSYAMELSHYDPVPAHIQQQIVAQYKPKAEED